MAKNKLKKYKARNDNSSLTFFLLLVIVVQFLLLLSTCQKKAPQKKTHSPKAHISKPIKKRIEARAPQKQNKALIAIVLDDWGYNIQLFKKLKEIDEPLTLAVLPNLAYSQQISQESNNINKEVILHLPLEPKNEAPNRLEKNTILTSMTKSQIENILKNSIDSLEGLKGISNHQGSKATENQYVMKIIFALLKERNLYFLDSFTSRTVCKALAKSMGLPYAQRHVFLDNENNYENINRQLKMLLKVAKQQGYAIGIGHARPKTIAVLKEEMPKLKEEGYKFVFVSELTR